MPSATPGDAPPPGPRNPSSSAPPAEPGEPPPEEEARLPAGRGEPAARAVRELQAKLWYTAFVGVPVLVALILLVAFGFVLH